MKNDAAIKAACQSNSDFTSEILDDFLLHYAADKDKLGKEVDQRLRTYRHVIQGMDKAWVNLIKSQYIMHRVFKKGGLVHKYLKHAALARLPEQGRKWLEEQAAAPWKFSFSRIIESPETDFYTMEDLFTGEQYLLYSTGVSRILKQGEVVSWFNLIGYNGYCWQAFGPLSAYRSFSTDDIFFFATELNSRISSDEELMADVSKNPVPYMMLYCRSNYPLTVHDGEVLELIITEIEELDLVLDKLDDDFEMDRAQSVYQLRLKNWENKPHFAVAYYDSKEQFLQVTAMTQKGYAKLVAAFQKQGIQVADFADIYVRPSMLTAAREILNRPIELLPLELLFEKEVDPQTEEELDKINQFLALAMPDLNSGKEPDLEALAAQVGLDLEANRETLQGIFAEVRKKQKK
ncbi:hypothetical protein [Cyclobacterium salsum]|uniref:hypothetical protein n=1 Tax=Cyclobacterium salsum TaxID=2666329 RepID=UPI001391E500|nr:hypothetical protein [Cyclobacterium salsum]